MREIKFRAWNGVLMLADCPHLMLDSRGLPYWHFGCSEPSPMSDTVLMQSTGLKDKNGKKIYEGDVLDGSVFGRAIVEAHKDNPGYLVARYLRKTIDDYGFDNVNGHEYEVIGNIYENPELLD